MDLNEPRIDPISDIRPKAITERQREVARLVASGFTNGQIAEELGVTLDTAKFHVSGLLTRLGLRRREEVAEWYRAHFGPVVRLRAWVRGLVALPTIGWIGGASAVGTATLVAVFVLVVRAGAISTADGAPNYVPFAQEWEISSAERETEYATLDWDSCEEWTYEVRDAVGTTLGSARSDGGNADGSCHIPGFWFLPINSYRANPDGRDAELAPYIYERTYRSPCTAAEDWSPTEALPPDFCVDPAGTFEDRTHVEFDPATEIPMRYTQYIDAVVTEERLATSLTIK